MSPFMSELVGTTCLLTIGDGVVANVVLNKTKGNNSGWIVIAVGWGMAVFVGVYVSSVSGAHLNPAVTLALAITGKFKWVLVPGYIVAQMLGALIGSTLVWLMYRDHFAITDADSKLAVFCTGPAIRDNFSNFLTEFIASFIFIFAVLKIVAPSNSLGALDALPVGLLVLGIGLGLGGPTGYAINPARDLGPRIAHALLPIKGKRDSDWTYAWIPVFGPLLGGVLAAIIFKFL
jgi:glycerol uptake facilitator protein